MFISHALLAPCPPRALPSLPQLREIRVSVTAVWPPAADGDGVAARRGTTADALRRALRGDLDRIVAREAAATADEDGGGVH